MSRASAPSAFPLEVQFGTACVELSLPLSTTFGALHKKMRRHWGLAAQPPQPNTQAASADASAQRQSRLQDADGNTFQPEELVLEWVGQLPDGIVYLVADPAVQPQPSAAAPADPRADMSPNAALRSYAPASASASAAPSSNAPPPSLSAAPASSGAVAAPLAVRRGAASGAPQQQQQQQPPAAAATVKPQASAATVAANGATSTAVVKAAPRQPAASPARKAPVATPQRAPQSAARPASVAVSSSKVAPASATARPAPKRSAGRKSAGAPAAASAASSSSSSTALTPRSFPHASLEAALWRVFSSYSMLGPHGCPDALSSQLFFKLLMDCGLANKNIDRGGNGNGSAVARAAPLAPGPHAAVAELLPPPTASASSSSSSAPAAAAPAPPSRLHAPPPPCTPLRRSDVELIYIEALKLQVLPAGGLAALQSSASAPPSTISDILNTQPLATDAALGAGAAVKMNFELFVHALLAVAMSFFGSPDGALALPARSDRLRVGVAVSQLATAPWDSEEHAASLHRLVLEYILPRASVWDDRESPAGRVLVSRDLEVEDVVRQFELPLLMLFRRYANVPDLSVRAMQETRPFAEGKEDRESKENDFSPRAKSPVASESAAGPAAPAFLQLVASVRSDVVLSWNQWASFCTDMKLARMLLTNQDTSRIFVQECYARTISEQRARRGEIPGRISEACGPTGADGFYLNPQRLSLTLSEFIYAFVRCALVGLGKMQLAVGPAWMLKAFLASAQSHVVLASASAQGDGLQSAHSNAVSGSTSKGGSTPTHSKSLSQILGSRTNSAALSTSLFKAVAKLRERYTTMWRADACINYFDAIAVHARLDSMALNDAREKEREQQQQAQAKSGSKPAEPPVRMRPVFAAPSVFKLALPPTSSPQTAAEWSTVVDASFRELCRHIAREHDPHRAVLESMSPSAAAASSAASGAPKTLMSPRAAAGSSSSSHARSMSSPVAKAKRNPSASPTGRSGQAAPAAPSAAPAPSPVAAAAAKSPYEHLLLFPRRSAASLAAVATPAPKVETLPERKARTSHAAQIKAARLARRENRKSMQAALQLEEHPPPVPVKEPSKEVRDKADKLFQAYQRSITHPEEVAAAAAAAPNASSSSAASPPADSALIPVPTSARKHASTPRKMFAPAPSPRRPQLEGRLVMQRVDQFETPRAAAAAAAASPRSKSMGGGEVTLLRIEAPPRSHSRTASPRSRSVTPQPKSPRTPRPHSPHSRAADRVAARADARARAASITLSSPPLSARHPSKSHALEAEEKKEAAPEEAPAAVDSDEDLIDAITVSAQGTARGRPKSPLVQKAPTESPRTPARTDATTDDFADDEAAADGDGDLNLSLDDDNDASLWDSPAAVVAAVAANKFTPRDEPVSSRRPSAANATLRKEQVEDRDFPSTQQQQPQQQASPATPSFATRSRAPSSAAATAPAPTSARGAPSASLPASAIAAAASSPISPSGGVRLRNLQVSPIMAANPAPVQHDSFANEAALDGDASFAQVQDEEQQYAPEEAGDEALEADLFGADQQPEEDEQIVSSAADDDYLDDAERAGGGGGGGGDDQDDDVEANERFLRGEVSARGTGSSRKGQGAPSKSQLSAGQVEAFEPEQDEDAAAEEEEQKDSFPVAPAAVPASASGKKLTPMQEAAQKRAQEVAAKQAYDATIARQNAAVAAAASSKAAAESAAQASAQSASQKLVEDSLALHRALTDQVQRGAFMTKLTAGVFSTKAQKKFVRVSSHGDKLFWGPDASTLNKSLLLADIYAIRDCNSSAQSKSFSKLKPAELACAFSVVTKSRSLDLIAPNQETREGWVQYFKTITRVRIMQAEQAAAQIQAQH